MDRELGPIEAELAELKQRYASSTDLTESEKGRLLADVSALETRLAGMRGERIRR